MSSPDPNAPKKSCAYPNCTKDAGYKAPKSKNSNLGYHWLCLEHVRLYNAKWDFFKGMSSEQIQREEHATFYWNQPTWSRSNIKNFAHPTIKDDIFTQTKTASKEKQTAPATLLQSLKILNLFWPVTKETLQKQYRFYAKKYHPDMNPDNALAEKQFKKTNQAYQEIKKFLERNESFLKK
ncbi:J domain-containing protein [Acetobacteraceae bacterium]|nr:J domain-containing protein [Acetobacteraceae bacterium]